MLAFVEQKGFSLINKYAMEAVVSEKAVEMIEKKAVEIGDKAGVIVDDELAIVEKKVADMLSTAEDRLKQMEAVKKVEGVIDKLDDNPAVKKVMDEVADSVIEQIDGRVFSCGCFAWDLSLRITRKTQKKPQATPEEILNIELPGEIPNVLAKPRRQSKPLRSSQTDSAPQS